MICIYSPTNTNYSNNGDAVLIPTRCELSMSINGAWQLSMEHPYDPEERYKYIQEGAVIRADIRCISELDTVQQRFRIYTYQRNLTNVTCIAFPVAMESNFDAPVDNLVLQNKTAAQAISSIQTLTNKYTITTNVTGTASSSWANTNINGILASGDDGCFIKVWGGEVLYDNLKFNIRQRIGSDNGFKVEYGNNLTGIDYSKDDSGLSTRVHPISQDGIRLNGDGYVDSPHINDYPIVHDRYIQAPYTLVEDDAASPSRTAQKTREAVAAITSTTTSLSETAYSAAISAGYQPEYIKIIQKDIVTAVQTMALYGVVSADLYKLMANTIANAMAWLGNLEQPEWEWRGSDSTGWWYGNDDGYAENMYVRIGRTWSYFGSNGYWQEPADDTEDWDWYEPKDSSGKKYGNFKKYFAHNEFVYITVEGVLKKYWFDEEGWYDEDQSGDSEWDWHGSGTALDPYWFGEEAAGDDEKKYAHSCWLFIDGVLYFFDQYGYYDGSTKFDDYQWDWVESDARYWFGNAEDDAYAATYLTGQWEKIDGAWYYFDANGYVVDTETSKATAIGVWTTNMASLTTAIGTYSTQLYTLLYTIMTEWVNKLYASGIDLPALTINVSMVDLSKTSEYENYAELATVKLGDGIVVDDPAHGITLTNRVIGLTYDCIREYNSYVVIGKAAATVQSMLSQASGEAVAGGFDTSAMEAQINSKLTDVRYKGASLVSGNVAVLDDVITEVEANPSSDAGTNLVKLRVGNSIYAVPQGGGSASISYGVDVPSGGSDGDVYLQHANTGIYVPRSSNLSGESTTISWQEQVYELYIHGRPTGGGSDDVYFEIRGLTAGQTYTLDLDFQFTDVHHFMGPYGDWLYIEDLQGNFIQAETVQLVDDFLVHHYQVSFTAKQGGTRIAFYFNNIADGWDMQAYCYNVTLTGDVTIDWEEPREIIDIWQNVDGVWYSYLEEPYRAGAGIEVDGHTISATNIKSGTTAPTTAIGDDGDIYIEFDEDSGESDWSVGWEGNISTNRWAAPVLFNDFDISQYYRLRFTGSGGNPYNDILVSDIKDSTSGEYSHISADDNRAYLQKSADGKDLYLYSGTGYTTSMTKVEVTTYDEDVPTDIVAVYTKIDGHWLEISTGGGGSESYFEVVNGELCQVYDDGQ